MKNKYDEKDTGRILKELEKKYGIPSVEVFYGYVNHKSIDIPKEDIVKWVHHYIVHNKHKMEVR
ncbi:MAG: hypothetical protein ACOC1O_06465 [bacterium]